MSREARFLDYVKLSRLPLMALGLLAGTSLLHYHGKLWTLESLVLIVTITAGNAFFNMMNEYIDMEADYLAGKKKVYQRVIVNHFTVSKIVWVLILFMCIGTYILHHYSWVYVMLVMIMFTAGIIYNGFQKRDWTGNIVLGICYGATALICTYPDDIWFPLIFFLYVITHNLIVQYQDYTSDKAVGIQTVAVRYGWRYTLFAVIIMAITGMIVIVLCGEWDYAIFFVPFIIILGVAVFSYTDHPDKHNGMINRWIRGYTRIMLGVAFITLFFR